MNVQILERDVVGFFSFRKVNLLFPSHWQDMTVLLVNILKILWRVPFVLRWDVYRNVYCGNDDCGNDLCVKFYKSGKFQILVNNQTDALFHVFIYSFHLSTGFEHQVLIIRRSNCINISSSMISLYKWLLRMPVLPSWQAYQAATYKD